MSAGIITSAYIAASVLFILSLGGLSNQETARRGNLFGILGMAIAAPAFIFLCANLLAEAADMGRTDQRVFTLLSFYASAIPLLFLGLVIVQEGWSANPKTLRRQFFLNLCFLLGAAGLSLNEPDTGAK